MLFPLFKGREFREKGEDMEKNFSFTATQSVPSEMNFQLLLI